MRRLKDKDENCRDENRGPYLSIELALKLEHHVVDCRLKIRLFSVNHQPNAVVVSSLSEAPGSSKHCSYSGDIFKGQSIRVSVR